MRAPWLDRAGRFSWLKAATLALCALPAAYLGLTWALVGLGPRPLNTATHETGAWAIRFVLITLAVTPARHVFDWPRLINIRRMLGLTALAYALLHFSLYVVDQNFILINVAFEIATRIYLAIGFVALAGLIVLGATSTDAAIKRLGQKWVKLHRLIYLIAAVALVHDFMQTKLDVTKAVFLSGYYCWLMGFRLARPRVSAIGPGVLAALALAAAIGTALVEVGWYGLMTGVSPARVLAANFDFSFEFRPAWWVLAAGLVVLVLQLMWRAIAPKGRTQKPPQTSRLEPASLPSRSSVSNS